jgi:hypothetical protein
METQVDKLRRQQAHEEVEFLAGMLRGIAYRLSQLQVGTNTNHRTYASLREHYVLLTQLLADAILKVHGFTFEDLPLHVYLGDGGSLVRLAGDASYSRYLAT